MSTSSGGRSERDSLGLVSVPHDRLWGASTQRALDSGIRSAMRMHPAIIAAMVRIKLAAARANRALGEVPGASADLIERACLDILAGHVGPEHFPVDVFQTGSGTSTNTNCNEVIANRCAQLARRPLGGKDPVHPNDHVNRCQSSNDVFPTAIHLAALEAHATRLDPALARLETALRAKAAAFADVVTVGRTHLQDATPVTMGMRCSGWAAQAAQARGRITAAVAELRQLPLGGTAVGTGLNAHPDFPRRAIAALAELTGLELVRAPDPFAAQGARDGLVACSGTLKGGAVALTKIANDLRLLASGPRCGFGELVLPALQPGSSIMPGKVNPVATEAAIQACVQIVGNDATVGLAGMGGIGSMLELNVAMPVMARNLLESFDLLASAAGILAERAIAGMTCDEERCADLVGRSLSLATALAPTLGYDRAAALAQRAWREQRTLGEVVAEELGASPGEVARLLDPRGMLGPGPARG
jgi:fumarate hydratase class II